ncbi:unnamed protein product [Leptosia nina]|uniref:Uncharacterized protein n=1 Tax=Leptosia nina TaxID=320188 RepID=A0AAV1JND1_9NEOP
MMFNGLLTYSDSECGDHFKVGEWEDGDVRAEKSGPPSVADSGAEAERARCLQDKLLATLQILKNKEETVRVQAESLALAEERITALVAKATPPATLTRTHRGLQASPNLKNSANGSNVETTDVSIAAQTQEVDRRTVKSLKDRLSVVEDLYRDCFYESAKQDSLLDCLRRSHLDLCSKERERTLDTKKSLYSYQNFASEVESFKTEISNYLNGSNNDSGMWERSEECDISEELQQIASQLHHLRELLIEECTCGLDEDHKRLKRANEANEMLIGELRHRIGELEEALGAKEIAERGYQNNIADKDEESNQMTQLLNESPSSSRKCCCDELSLELKQVQGLLQEKTLELTQLHQKCHQQDQSIRELKRNLHRADTIVKENRAIRDEVKQLRAEVSSWREQLEDSRRYLRELEHELHRSRQRYRHLEEHYRERTSFADELHDQLEEAQSQSATLCQEMRNAVTALRRCHRKHRDTRRQQQEQLQQQETLIRALQNSHTESERLTEPCCSKRLTSSSEPTPPTPPRRLLRKKPSTHPTRSECGTSTSQQHLHVCSLLASRAISPTDELLERVERAHDALADAQRRWCQHGHSGHRD